MFEQELVFCLAPQWLMNNARWQLLFPGCFGFTLVWEGVKFVIIYTCG